MSGRRAALQTFLVTWFGGSVAAPKQVAGCPEVLRWWWGLWAANPCLRGVQNKFVEPERYVPDPFLVHGSSPRVQEPAPELWAFWAENQGVTTLFCEGHGEDPAVWGRSEYRPTFTECFLRERESLTGQLLRWTLMEALYDAPVGGTWATIDRQSCEAALDAAKLVALPLAALGPPSDSLVFYAGAGLIAATQPTEWPDDVAFIVGARSEAPVRSVADCIAEPWELGLP